MKEKRAKSKKEILIYEILAVILMVIGFASMFISITLDNAQPDNNWITYGIIAFLSLMGIALFLRSVVREDKEVLRLENRHKLYSKMELSEVDFISLDVIKEELVVNNYELLSNGFYFKKVATQGVCYYGRFVISNIVNNVLEKEIMRFKKFQDKNCKSINGIIFFAMPKTSDDDKLFVKNLSRDMVIAEEVPVNNNVLSVITVLIDEEKKKAYYFDVLDSYRSKVYTYGCLLLRKIFRK
ncbi:MAG: hypothetical protein RQ856_06880 [Candidatus Izemoplasmatales bacterium]|nr:hypothetical protein [Candidatus Izemoplasmatales bacterium]